MIDKCTESTLVNVNMYTKGDMPGNFIDVVDVESSSRMVLVIGEERAVGWLGCI